MLRKLFSNKNDRDDYSGRSRLTRREKLYREGLYKIKFDKIFRLCVVFSII